MAYDAMLARSFSRYDQRKLGFGALVACLLIALSFCTVFKPYLGPLPVLNLKLSMGIGHKLFATQEAEGPTNQWEIENENAMGKIELFVNSTDYKGDVEDVKNVTYIQEVVLNFTSQQADNFTKQPEPSINSVNQQTEESVKINRAPLCNMSEPRSDICEISTAVTIHPNVSTVFVPSPVMDESVMGNDSWRIKPYARKGDIVAMSLVREWLVTPRLGLGQTPECTRNHSVPAVVFSVRGFSGNHFHDFSDIILPLYLTSRKFDGEVQFVVTDYLHWWTVKFREVLEKLSKYPIIDIDNEKDIHCYPSAIIGLRRHKGQQLAVDPSESPHYTTRDFREFLRSSYSLKRSTAIKLRDGDGRRPRLLILSRKWSRSFTNVGRIVRLARGMGFEVVVAEADMNVARFAKVINSCDVVMGVHGAGLTNILFLPENGVLIQVVPFGGVEWVSRTYFGEPTKDMGIKYLEYGINLQESTLIEQFPADDTVLRNPVGYHKNNWELFRSVYLDKQNVKLDVRRFKPTLQRALQLLHE